MQDIHLECSRDGMAPIHVAAAQNLPPRVQRLVQISHTLLEARTSNKASMTPLMVAAANGASESFHALLGLGANLRALSGTGMGAINYAATRGHTPIALSLLENEDVDVMQELLDQLLQRPMSHAEKVNCLRVLAGMTQAIAAQPTDRYSHGRSKVDHLRGLGVVTTVADLLRKVTSGESGWESPAQQLMLVVTHLASVDKDVGSDIMAHSDILRTMVGIMQKSNDPSTCVAVVQAFKAMIKTVPSACFQIMGMGTPLIMMEALRKHRSEPFLEAAMGCMEISTSKPEVARALTASGILPGLAGMVGSPHLPPNAGSSLLNIVENVATCSEEGRKGVVTLGVVQTLLGLLSTERTNRIGRILGLLHALCLGKEDGGDIVRGSPPAISRLVSLVRHPTSPSPIQQASFELLWWCAVGAGGEGERRALAGLVGARCLSFMLDRGAEGLQGKVLDTLLLIAPPIHGLQQEMVEAGCVHSLVRIVEQAKPLGNVTSTLRILEALGCTMAMRPNRKFQQLMEKLGGRRCLLKLYSAMTDKDTLAQTLCTLTALTVGCPALKQSLLQDLHIEPSQVASSMVTTEMDHVSTLSRALCYLLYNSGDLQGTLAERVGTLPYVTFETRQCSQDRSERARAWFEAIVMAKLFADQDSTMIKVEGIKNLSRLLEEAVEEGDHDLQVNVGSLVCALLRTGEGLGGAFLSLELTRPLVAMLLGTHEGALKTSSLALCVLSHLPRGARAIMKYGRRAPYLIPLIQRYSPMHPLSPGFCEDWIQYCKDHPKAVVKQAQKITVISSLYGAAKVFANVKVDESPALTDQGEGQEEEEPRMFCGIPQRHYSKSSITLKPRETVASLKLPSITQPDM